MKVQVRSALLSFALLLVAAAAWAKISTDYDHNVSFTSYTTYSWGKLEMANSIWDKRVKSAIDSQLVTKGWTLVPSGGDVVVNAFGKTRPGQTPNTFYNVCGGGSHWAEFGTATTTFDTYKVGALVIDMVDANTKNLIWRGVASDTLSSNSSTFAGSVQLG